MKTGRGPLKEDWKVIISFTDKLFVMRALAVSHHTGFPPLTVTVTAVRVFVLFTFPWLQQLGHISKISGTFLIVEM